MSTAFFSKWPFTRSVRLSWGPGILRCGPPLCSHKAVRHRDSPAGTLRHLVRAQAGVTRRSDWRAGRGPARRQHTSLGRPPAPVHVPLRIYGADCAGLCREGGYSFDVNLLQQ